MPAGPVSRPWRRFLRFSVRGLMIVVLVIGAGMGLIVHSVRSARVQRDSVSTIRKAGGGVYYDWQMKNGMLNQNRKQRGPKWLVDRLGVDYFGNPIFVVNGRGMTDRELVHIGHLAQLRRLYLDESSVSDAGLSHLKGLQSLQWLGLNNTQVTDAGLAHLKGLTNLSVLYVGGTPVTEAGMSELMQALPRLHISRQLSVAHRQ